MIPNLEDLYFLENDSLSMVEIKRLDAAVDADVSQIYQWMLIDKKAKSIEKLDFDSMDYTEQIEEHFFKQGYLKFIELDGNFIEKYNSAQHKLENIDARLLSLDLLSSIEKWLHLHIFFFNIFNPFIYFIQFIIFFY
ncbi:hypothetical protein [Pedobacter sp. MW01-1-1]|uniref:hypothetical protein n=1 Tax=Pedobacter sp. MW01-1-1 TaxID=3383027 RepID=UPI003FF0486D